MAINRPYEEYNDSIIPNIGMAGVLSAAGYASYKVYKGEGDDIKNFFTEAYNKVFPMKKIPTSEIQDKIEKTYQHVKENMEFARRRKEATYAARDTSLTKAYNRIAKTGRIGDLEISQDALEQFRPNHGVDLKNLTVTAEDIGHETVDEILDGIKDRYGLRDRPSYTFRDTDMIVNVNGDELTVPTSKYVKEMDAYVSKRGAYYRVAPRLRNIDGENGKILTEEIISPNKYIADSLKSENAAIYAANDPKVARDILESRKVDSGLNKAISVAQTERGVQDFHNFWSLKRMMAKIENSYQHFVHTDIAKGEFLGKQIIFNPYRKYLLSEKPGFSGIDNEAFSMNTVSYFGERPPNATEYSGIDQMARINQRVRAGEIRTSFRLDRGDDISGVYGKNISYILGQSPTAEGKSSYLGVHTANREVDALKSIKGNYFTNPINRKFTQPLIWNNSIADTARHTYGAVRNSGFFNAITVIDNNMADEMIEMRGRVANRMEISSATSVKVKKFVFGADLQDADDIKDAMLSYRVRENGKILKRKGTLGDIFEAINSGDITRDNFIRIDARRGSILGFSDPTAQIDSMAANNALDTATDRIVRAKHNLRITGDDLFGTITDGDTKYIPAKIREMASKVGDLSSKTRSALGVMSSAYESRWTSGFGKAGFKFLPHGRMSGKLFEKTLLDGSATGKNVGELLTFLQQSIAGHVHGYGLNVDLSGDLGKYASMIDGQLTFTQSADDIQGQIGIAQKTLANIRRGLTGSNIADDAELLKGQFLNAGDKPWLSMMSLAAHEGPSVQGLNNIYRVDMKSMPWDVPELMDELSRRSLTNTPKMFTEAHMMMNPDLRPDMLEKVGVKILNKDGLSNIMGNLDVGRITENMQDRNLISGTFLSKEVNPDGFALRGWDGRLVKFGSAEFYGGGHWLAKEEKLAWQGFVNSEARVIQNAMNNGGIVSEKDWMKLMMERAGDNASSKAGVYSRAAMQIEGGVYNINIGSSGFINNNAWVEKIFKPSHFDSIKGMDEFRQLFGNMALMDAGLYKREIQERVTDIVDMARHEGRSAFDIMREAHGEGSALERYIKPGMKLDDIKPEEIAKKATTMSVKLGNRIRKEVELLVGEKGGDVDLLNRLIKLGDATMFHRFPNVGTKSRSLGFMFASIEDFGGDIEGKRAIALGNILRTNLNADNDGDKIFSIMTYMKETRKATEREIMGAQKVSAYYMNLFKKKDAIKALYISAGDEAKFTFPGQKILDGVADSIREMEVSSVKSAMMTKMMTGSAHVKAAEIKNAMLSDIMDSKAKGDDLAHALGLLNQPGQQIEQNVISAKQLQGFLDESGKSALHSITTMMSNIGHVTKEGFIQGVAAARGDLSAVHMAAAFKATKDARAPWLTKGNANGIYDQFNTLMNMTAQYRPSTEAELRKLHPLLGTGEAEDAWVSRYMERQKGMSFLVNKAELKSSGLTKYDNYLDMIDSFDKRGLLQGSESAESAFFRAVKKVGKNSEDAVKLVEQYMRESLHPNVLRAAAEGSFVENIIRSQDIRAREARTIIGQEAIEKFMGKITVGKVAGGIGLGLVAMTALNVIGGDGTPEDINDLPSVSNPSFGGQSYGNISSPRTIGSSMNSNMSMGLLTDRRANHEETLQTVSAMFGGRINNTVSVRSDGTDPYKSDMYMYKG